MNIFSFSDDTESFLKPCYIREDKFSFIVSGYYHILYKVGLCCPSVTQECLREGGFEHRDPRMRIALILVAELFFYSGQFLPLRSF